MDWLGAMNWLSGITWLILFGMIWAGGWLLSTHLFRVKQRERLLVGLALGWLLFIVLSNLIAWVIPLFFAWWVASALILAAGLVTVWRHRLPGWNWREDWRVGPQIAALALLLIIFTLINRGLAIFDDYHNLPLTSRMAAGDFPPHFHLNPSQLMAYHYGLHLFAASLVRIGRLAPWSAFDIAKALSLAMTFSLAWLWFRRMAGGPRAEKWAGALLGALLILFGGGARWLLALLPPDWLTQISSGLHLLGSGADSGPNLYTTLAGAWKIEGGGPIPFPFAFVNGIFVSLNFAMGGPGALPQMTILLLLLLARQRWNAWMGLVYGLVLASLALTGEHLYVLFWCGFLGVVLLMWFRNVKGRAGNKPVASWGWVLIPSLLIGIFGGGVLTVALRGWLFATSSVQLDQSFGFAGFGIRLPPAILSAHLGTLSLTSPAQILIALAEIGPVILLAPWTIRRTWRQGLRKRVVMAGIGLASIVGFLIPIFIRYGMERDISRLMGSALFIWLILGVPLIWQAWQTRGQWSKFLIGLGYVTIILGGIALFTIQWVAIARPQLTYFAQETDAAMARKYWNRLEPDAQVFDTIPIRSITVFGRTSGRAYMDWYNSFPEWQALAKNYNPVQLAQAGYSYIYIDRDTWQRLSIEQKQALQNPCVQKLSEATAQNKDFRWLLDIKSCR